MQSNSRFQKRQKLGRYSHLLNSYHISRKKTTGNSLDIENVIYNELRKLQSFQLGQIFINFFVIIRQEIS